MGSQRRKGESLTSVTTVTSVPLPRSAAGDGLVPLPVSIRHRALGTEPTASGPGTGEGCAGALRGLTRERPNNLCMSTHSAHARTPD